jgi:hypothetical protein
MDAESTDLDQGETQAASSQLPEEETQAAYAWQLEEPETIPQREVKTWGETFLTIGKVAAVVGLLILAAHGTDFGQRVESHLPGHPPAAIAVVRVPPPEPPIQVHVNPTTIGEFDSLLAGQNMHRTDFGPTLTPEAQTLCQDAADGNLQNDIDATRQKSVDDPSARPDGPSLVVHHAILAFCPQYG